jgi:hypothetical protein
MEYASDIYNNDMFIKHVGYSDNLGTDYPSPTEQFYSQKNVNKISKKITELLMGVDKNNRPIVVPDKNIYNIMNSVYANFRPETGDIFTRYHIPNEKDTNTISHLTNQVINIIVSDIRNNLGMEECNSKLTVWTTVLGDFNKHGLRRHSKIKLREKRITPMLFQMNY